MLLTAYCHYHVYNQEAFYVYICCNFWLCRSRKTAISEVMAKILTTPLGSWAIFPEKAEYLNDRKITAVLVYFFFSCAQNQHYLYFWSEICCHRHSQ